MPRSAFIPPGIANAMFTRSMYEMMQASSTAGNHAQPAAARNGFAGFIGRVAGFNRVMVSPIWVMAAAVF